MHPGGEFSVTMSCGVAMLPNFDDVPSLAEAADQALYEAETKDEIALSLLPPTTKSSAKRKRASLQNYYASSGVFRSSSPPFLRLLDLSGADS